jgi:P-type Cu+ transporter
MAKSVLKIQGMTCEHCVRAIQQSLLAVPGVKAAEVSLAEKKAVLTYDGVLDIEATVQAVENEGYKAKLE